MNIKTTVFLVIALLVVGGYLFFTRDTGNEENKKPQEKKLLADVASASDVKKVTITPADGKVVEFERKGTADWRMTKPVAAPADPTEVNALVDNVIALKSTNVVDANAGTRTGLDKPQYVVQLDGDKSAKVSFGDKLGVGNGVYAKVDGQSEIDVVPADVLEKLDKPASSFRQAKLVEASSFDIKQLVIDEKTGGRIALQKQGNDWQMTEPKAMPADNTAVTDLLNALTGLKAASFVEDPSEVADAMKGTNPLVTSVAYSTTAPSTQPSTQPASQPALTTITFGSYDDVLKKKVYAKVSDSPFVAKVDATALTSLDKKPIDLRDKKLVDVTPDEVSRFSVTTDVPAATQPTSRPAKKGEVVVERRNDAGNKGVPFVAAPPTQPSTKQSVADKLELPNAKKPSPWVLADGATADESEVTGFLGSFHPLRVDKYLETNPATQPTVSHYVVKIRTESAGGAKSADYEIRFADRGAEQPLIGEYNGVTFEATRFNLARYLEGDFKTKPAGANPAVTSR